MTNPNQPAPRERVVKSIGLDGRVVYMTKREEKAWRRRTKTKICCDNGNFGEKHDCQKQPG